MILRNEHSPSRSPILPLYDAKSSLRSAVSPHLLTIELLFYPQLLDERKDILSVSKVNHADLISLEAVINAGPR